MGIRQTLQQLTEQELKIAKADLELVTAAKERREALERIAMFQWKLSLYKEMK